MRYFFNALCMLMLSVPQPSFAENCQVNTLALQSMQTVKFLFIKKGQTINVKLADTNNKRAAGFQSICAETITNESMLFLFHSELQPAFHMRNVVAALDIAFIDVNGRIVSIQTMQPYVQGSLRKPTYSPNTPVIAALETYEGFFDEHGISIGTDVRWSSQ